MIFNSVFLGKNNFFKNRMITQLVRRPLRWLLSPKTWRAPTQDFLHRKNRISANITDILSADNDIFGLFFRNRQLQIVLFFCILPSI